MTNKPYTDDRSGARGAMSQEYRKALAKNDEANLLYRKAQAAYRAMEIGDNEFLSARKAWSLATEEFDAAFAKEAGWTKS